MTWPQVLGMIVQSTADDAIGARRPRHRSAHRPGAARARDPARRCEPLPRRRRDRGSASDRPPRLARTGSASRCARGWEGRILRRQTENDHETTYSVVHLATFPLPEERGDFGAGVTELMRSPDVFVVLFEYGPESLGSPMFAGPRDPAPHRRPVQQHAAATPAPRPGRLPALLHRRRPAVLPLRRRREPRLPAADHLRGQRGARRPGDRPVIAAPPKETFSQTRGAAREHAHRPAHRPAAASS